MISLYNFRPYHGLLLLDNEMSILQKLPIDASPALAKLLKVVTPVKNLHELALDSALSLSQVSGVCVYLTSHI